MSILLEALRKSEKNQKQHEVPTIHTDDQSSPVSESIRIGPLALIIVVVLFVSGWFIWRQYQAPDGGYQPPVTLAPEKISAISDQVSSSRPGAGEVPETPLSSTVADNSAVQQRTPVESYQEPARNTSQADPGSAETSINKDPAERVADSGSSKSTPRMATSRAPVPVTLEENVSYIPEPISYWELPDAIRTEVPEIRFTVLVYANNPEDRFVLINGQRLGEGDSFQTGLVVEEIRRDGVVFSYRLYQFLVER